MQGSLDFIPSPLTIRRFLVAGVGLLGDLILCSFVFLPWSARSASILQMGVLQVERPYVGVKPALNSPRPDQIDGADWYARELGDIRTAHADDPVGYDCSSRCDAMAHLEYEIRVRLRCVRKNYWNHWRALDEVRSKRAGMFCSGEVGQKFEPYACSSRVAEKALVSLSSWQLPREATTSGCAQLDDLSHFIIMGYCSVGQYRALDVKEDAVMLDKPESRPGPGLRSTHPASQHETASHLASSVVPLMRDSWAFADLEPGNMSFRSVSSTDLRYVICQLGLGLNAPSHVGQHPVRGHPWINMPAPPPSSPSLHAMKPDFLSEYVAQLYRLRQHLPGQGQQTRV